MHACSRAASKMLHPSACPVTAAHFIRGVSSQRRACCPGRAQSTAAECVRSAGLAAATQHNQTPLLPHRARTVPLACGCKASVGGDAQNRQLQTRCLQLWKATVSLMGERAETRDGLFERCYPSGERLSCRRWEISRSPAWRVSDRLSCFLYCAPNLTAKGAPAGMAITGSP